MNTTRQDTAPRKLHRSIVDDIAEILEAHSIRERRIPFDLSSLTASPAMPAAFIHRGGQPSTYQTRPSAPPSPPPVQLQPQRPQTDFERMDIDALRADAAVCRRCPLCESRIKVVPGTGPVPAIVLFICDPPRKDEDAAGLPIVGAAAEKFAQIVKSIGLQIDQCNVASIVKCKPPRNRAPSLDELDACMPYLRRLVQLAAPKAVVTLGATPMRMLLNLENLKNDHGIVKEFLGVPAIATYHPEALLRDPTLNKPIWSDMKLLKRLLGFT